MYVHLWYCILYVYCMFSLLHKRFCLCIHAQQLFCRGLFWGNKTWPSLVSSRSHHTHGSIHILPVRGSHKQWLRLVRPSGQCPCCWWFGDLFWLYHQIWKKSWLVFHGSRSVFHDIFRDLELNTIKNWLVFRGSHNGAPVRVCGCWGEERAWIGVTRGECIHQPSLRIWKQIRPEKCGLVM